MNRKEYRQIKREDGVEIADAIRDLMKKLIEVKHEIVNNINNTLNTLSSLMGGNYVNNLTADTNQPAQDLTKNLTTFVGHVIITVCEKHNIPLVKNERNGSDLVYTYKGIDIDIEDKLRIFIEGNTDYCDVWTGNKNGGKKTDLHLLWVIEVSREDKVTGIAFSVVSLNENKTNWKTGGGKGGYSNLKINKSLTGVYNGIGKWQNKGRSNSKYGKLILEKVN